MTPFTWLMLVAAAVFIFWQGRWLPLAGVRRAAVISCRLAALGVLAAALWAPPRKMTQEQARHIVYLVDRSESIDNAQQSWMARRIASLEALRPKLLPRAIAAFGADARVSLPFSRQPVDGLEEAGQAVQSGSVDASRTNLEGALFFAASLIRPHPQGSIILLSDGRQTAGSALGAAAYLRRFGIAVFPQPPAVFSAAKSVWDTLSVSPSVARGAMVAVRLIVFNSAASPKAASVQLSVRGVPVKRQPVVLRSGWQVITVPVRAVARGTMPLEVRLDIASERFSETRMAYTEVEGPQQLLWVGQRLTELPALAQALKRSGMDVAVVRPEEFPADSKQMADYDAVLLFNLPKSVFSDAQSRALREYVENQGGGLVTVGLGGVLAEELQKKTALDELLPLVFEPKGMQEAKRRVCFIMLIDRSASMLGPRIAATKRAAIELVKQLAPEDMVGVLAFDTQAYVVAEVQPAAQVGPWLVEKLVKLHSTGGTDILPALAAAANRLELTGATVKHVLLLSDGNTPFQEQAYDAIVNGFRQDGITVSTIGIGPVFVNSDFLRWLSQSTGGSYYLMRSPEELPRLVVQDTQQQLGKLPFAEGYFRPKKSPATEWFEDTDAWPALRGFLTSTAKEGTTVDLTINGGSSDEPLLARWMLGRGRVVSFASDADAQWSADWIRWSGFDAAWAEVVRWVFKPRLTEEVFVWTDESGQSKRLTIEGELHEPTAELISADESERVALSLMPAGNFRWQAVLEQAPAGWYQLLLSSQQGEARVTARRWIQLGASPQGPELSGQPPDELLLRELAQATGGVYGMPDHAFVPPMASAPVTQPVLLWWLPWLIVLLLIEVALRGPTML